MKIAIVVDEWKLETFKKHLKNFEYEQADKIIDNTVTLIVVTDANRVAELKHVCENASYECVQNERTVH